MIGELGALISLARAAKTAYDWLQEDGSKPKRASGTDTTRQDSERRRAEFVERERAERHHRLATRIGAEVQTARWLEGHESAREELARTLLVSAATADAEFDGVEAVASRALLAGTFVVAASAALSCLETSDWAPPLDLLERLTLRRLVLAEYVLVTKGGVPWNAFPLLLSGENSEALLELASGNRSWRRSLRGTAGKVPPKVSAVLDEATLPRAKAGLVIPWIELSTLVGERNWGGLQSLAGNLKGSKYGPSGEQMATIKQLRSALPKLSKGELLALRRHELTLSNRLGAIAAIEAQLKKKQ